MFIEFPEHDKLISADSVARIEIQTIKGNADEIYKLVLYSKNNYSNNNNDLQKFVLLKSF